MMKTLLWAELQKLRRSNILFVTIFAVFFVAILVFLGGITMVYEEQYALNRTGWYLITSQAWATLFVLPAMITLFGSYLICREEQDDTMKSLCLIPISNRKLTAVKLFVTFVFSIFIYLLLFTITFLAEMVLHTSEKSLCLIPISNRKLTAVKLFVTFVFSIFIYLLLFTITFLAEMVLHTSDVSFQLFFHFLSMYFLDGIGVFFAVSPIIALVPYWKKSYWLAMVLAELFAVSPIIALVPYWKKSYWLAMVLAELYSFTDLFMSMSPVLKTFYPISAVLGVSGYYETSLEGKLCNILVLLLCGGVSLLFLQRTKDLH